MYMSFTYLRSKMNVLLIFCHTVEDSFYIFGIFFYFFEVFFFIR